MESQQHGEQLKYGPENRHTWFVTLGGAIGTGLFLGSASVIRSAGPEVILGCVIASLIALLIMRQLGEMVVEEPVIDSFNHFAYKYRGSFVGPALSWNYWVLYALVAMTELTAVGKYIQFWYPEIPTWASAAVFFAVISATNLTGVKVFGEVEFWSAIIRVTVAVAMIIFGARLLFSGNGDPQVGVNNPRNQGDFLSHGFTDPVMMMATIMFSFGSLELVGIIAAEADNPEWSTPKATNQVIYHILIFYIGSLAVPLPLMLWTRVTADTSPFIPTFHELSDTSVANTLNVVILIAALPVYDSCIYHNSRVLFGLAQQGNALKALASVGKHGVPVNTILVSALATVLCVLISCLTPEFVFGLLMALMVPALVINWVMISPAHMKSRRAKQEQGVVTRFPVLLYPLGNWICLLSMAMALVIMLMTLGMAISVYLILVWLIVLGIDHLFKKKTAKIVKVY